MNPENEEFLLVYFLPDSHEPYRLDGRAYTYATAKSVQASFSESEPSLRGRMAIFCESTGRYV